MQKGTDHPVVARAHNGIVVVLKCPGFGNNEMIHAIVQPQSKLSMTCYTSMAPALFSPHTLLPLYVKSPSNHLFPLPASHPTLQSH